MRDPVKENREREDARGEELKRKRERAVNVADAVFKTDDGRELLGYLCEKFHLHGRAFLSGDVRAPACPFTAATRDGERAVLWHLISLARETDPKFPIP